MRHVADRFTAMLDANVLYPFLVRDVLLSLAEAGLYRPVWTAEINAEWSENLIAGKPEREAAIKATIEAMNEAFPEAVTTGYEDLIPSLTLPDNDDRHVLAAAIRSGASVIVTENLKDFPPDILAKYDIETRSADEFVLNTFEFYPTDALHALKTMRTRYKNPPATPAELIQRMLKSGLVTKVAALQGYEDSI